LPANDRAAAAAFVCGLILDPSARSRALDRLQSWRPRLDQLWWSAADSGLADRELHTAAMDLFELARLGLSRLGEEFLSSKQRGHFEGFFERFTKRGLAPADWLRSALEADPAAALGYATGTRRGC
jgi:hypothetical protein